jgi:hypothetical protein
MEPTRIYVKPVLPLMREMKSVCWLDSLIPDRPQWITVISESGLKFCALWE